MKATAVKVLPVLLLGALAVSTSWASGPPDPEAMAIEMVRAAGWEIDAIEGVVDQPGMVGGELMQVDRILLSDDIVLYSFVIPTGSGPYDKIGLHRVVKERRPFKPIRTSKTLFFQHGTPGNFVNVFLFGAVSDVVPMEHSMAYFLADKGVDVWGIDQAWSLVPAGTEDFSFMESWGMQKDLDDLRLGLSVARLVRQMTGSGYGQMNLLGYSTGLTTGFAYLNEESQRPPRARNVGGYIPVDYGYKTDIEEARLGSCDWAAFALGSLEAGVYYEDFSYIQLMADLAVSDPEGSSPVIPGFTNLQAALFLGCGPLGGYPASFHFFAGVFDGGVPVDLQFVDVQALLGFMAHLTPYSPMRFGYDQAAVACDETDVPFDDHLGDISVPVLYLGAAGGVDTFGLYTLSLLGSTDVSNMIVRLRPPGEEALDFAHIDIFAADNAEELVWRPVYDWIKDHDHHPIEAPPGEESMTLAAARPHFTDAPLRVTPNPGRTSHYTVAFEMTTSGTATLEIYDVAGRKVAGPLVTSAPAGQTRLVWDVVSAGGRSLSQGIYFARVATAEGVQTAKFVHLGP